MHMSGFKKSMENMYYEKKSCINFKEKKKFNPPKNLPFNPIVYKLSKVFSFTHILKWEKLEQGNSKKFLVTWKTEAQSSKGEGGEIIYPLFTPQNCRTSQGSVRPTPKARNLLWVSHLYSGAISLALSSAAFPGAFNRELDWKCNSRDFNQHSVGMWWSQVEV